MKSGPLRALLATCLLAVPAGVSAEDLDHPVKPLMWKVEGKGLEEVSYLFGTIHLGSGPLANLHPAAEEAFERADSVYTEISLDPASQLALAPEMIRKDGKTLTESIGPELAAKLDEELKRINPELDAAPLDPLKTWTVAMTLPVLASQLKGEKAMDAMLWERAVADGKETAGLEKLTDQTGIFEDLSEEEQVALLGEVIRSVREDRAAGRDPVKEMIDAYVSGDPDRIQKEVDQSLKALTESEHKELGERLMKRLLDDRDVTLAATIDKLLQAAPAKTHFFAVGAGHFAGEVSIRSHLTAKGYRISRFNEE